MIATLIAAGIFTLTEHDDHRHTWWCAFEITLQTLLVIVGMAFFRTRLKLLHDTSVVQPILVMVVTLTLLCEPFQRFFLEHGHPFEVLVMHSQSNLMLALAVCGFRITFQRLAMLIAVFLTIFSCTISNASGLLPLTILFAIGCLVWLVASWWETVDRRLMKNDHGRRPLVWLGTAVSVPLLLMLTAAGFGANTVTTALKGFMPSSGGTGHYDPFSRGGVNDGDALVAGNKNVKSFAPLDDAPFMESDKPSLYDIFNDLFDEPPKIIKDQQRAIALPPEQLLHVHQKMAEAKQAGREFSLLRSGRKADRQRIHDLDTHAAFYVAGRVPAHFRMEIYEHFDGVTWYPLEDADPHSETSRRTTMRQIEDRHWLSIPLTGRGFEMYSGSDTHSLKVANLQGNVIPAPPGTVGVSIDRVDREDMYHVTSDGIVTLRRETIPEMTPIAVASECVLRERIAENSLVASLRRDATVTSVLPEETATDRVRQLAEAWTSGLPRGWPQIAAIEARLRQHAVVDRETRPADDCESPVAEFLFEQRRGPEYLFASSAACLLRSLGYSTRLISGFYAHPHNYDSRKQHTAVFARDAHFWCEVFIGSDAWVTVEATPGYEILGPPPTLFERLLHTAHLIWLAAVANAVPLVAAALLTILLLAYRRSIRERLLTWHWRWFQSGSLQQRTVSLAALVDYRLLLAGQPRPAGTTLLRWSRRADLSHVHTALQQLANQATAARYAPTSDELASKTHLESAEEGTPLVGTEADDPLTAPARNSHFSTTNARNNITTPRLTRAIGEASRQAKRKPRRWLGLNGSYDKTFCQHDNNIGISQTTNQHRSADTNRRHPSATEHSSARQAGCGGNGAGLPAVTWAFAAGRQAWPWQDNSG
ncbi:MAG: transglutaminase-like domain-containing protein [Planctomycetaceae bacterium]